ncbi:Rieske (2Fe-2S) protein [Nocardioides sp. Kera G14]|uniref:Rieske (2Fe-2S) protein n=1 Tax=Nocardioides sp. Kera G14 TaxID=2884264 RepID=UPI001D12963A|nr:Rieske (2Fe-2S) protein [Nocardioides sp. Kera G14]UDY25101.1 Rieske 2Fe-2S domain-containing protein [Nocardioides sp. Kera G14]
MTGLTRRGAVGAGIAVPLLAACGTSDDSASDTPTAPATSAAPSTATSSTEAPSASTSGRPAVPPLAAASDIEVGSGKIFKDERVVVTQPTAGEFKGFDATCTHQQCLVSKVDDDQIVCTCHFSKYSITDGSVEGGPAPAPLSPVALTVTDGEIYLA